MTLVQLAASFLQAVIVDLFSGGSTRRYSSCATEQRSRLAFTLTEQEEISRVSCGGSIYAIDGEVTGPLALDGEPSESAPAPLRASCAVDR